MKKSNWLIIGILVIASVIFLAMWFLLELNVADEPLDLVLTIIWWVVIIAICVAIHIVERQRMRSVRTIFVAPGVIYNSEAGIVRLQSGESYVAAIEHILSNLKYGFERQKVSDDSRIRFSYVVRTRKFSNHGRVWEGDVVKVSNPDGSQDFKNKAELSELLDDVA